MRLPRQTRRCGRVPSPALPSAAGPWHRAVPAHLLISSRCSLQTEHSASEFYPSRGWTFRPPTSRQPDAKRSTDRQALPGSIHSGGGEGQFFRLRSSCSLFCRRAAYQWIPADVLYAVIIADFPVDNHQLRLEICQPAVAATQKPPAPSIIAWAQAVLFLLSVTSADCYP